MKKFEVYITTIKTNIYQVVEVERVLEFMMQGEQVEVNGNIYEAYVIGKKCLIPFGDCFEVWEDK